MVSTTGIFFIGPITNVDRVEDSISTTETYESIEAEELSYLSPAAVIEHDRSFEGGPFYQISGTPMVLHLKHFEVSSECATIERDIEDALTIHYADLHGSGENAKSNSWPRLPYWREKRAKSPFTLHGWLGPRPHRSEKRVWERSVCAPVRKDFAKEKCIRVHSSAKGLFIGKGKDKGKGKGKDKGDKHKGKGDQAEGEGKGKGKGKGKGASTVVARPMPYSSPQFKTRRSWNESEWEAEEWDGSAGSDG